MTKDVWPEFISCVLAVREDIIYERCGDVQKLVDGVARTGLWIDQDKDTEMSHRMQAADIAAQKQYYNHKPELIRYVLSKPLVLREGPGKRLTSKRCEHVVHQAHRSTRFAVSDN